MHDPSDRWFSLILALSYMLLGIAFLWRAYIGEKRNGAVHIPSIVDSQKTRPERMSARSRAAWTWMGILTILMALVGIWRTLRHWS
jgi:hypothetical protein